MQKEINLSEGQKALLDRGMFEYGRIIDNVTFLLSAHLDDVDSSFLDSDVFRKAIHDSEEARLRLAYRNTKIVRSVLGKEPASWQFSDYNKKLIYSI